MKLGREKQAEHSDRPGNNRWSWPTHLFGDRIRTSTVLLIVAFLAVWWVYDAYREDQPPPAAPQVVPPGFIPDPAYTWVPRTQVQHPPSVTETTTSTPTTTEPPPESPESEPPSPTPVPGYPFCPPLCPPPTSAPPTPAPPDEAQPSPSSAPPTTSSAPPGAPTPSASPGPHG